MPTLLVIVGPTGVGKTELALRVAERYGCPIVNADSRQIYREIPIGTAAPTTEEQARVKHYFVGTQSLIEDYNAGQYERDAVEVLSKVQSEECKVQSEEGDRRSEVFAILTGGSMMYIDAVCKGLDNIPEVPETTRERLRKCYEEHGLEWLQKEVERIDPQYWNEVDRQNPQRLLHCLEVSDTLGRPYSTLRQGKQKERPWHIVKIGLRREREELYDRINRRVDLMMAQGLLDEVRRVYPWREKNSLQTVGYRELFPVVQSAECKVQSEELAEAVNRIRQNSRHYAKRQMTWWNRDKQIHWLDASQTQEELITEIDKIIRDENEA